MSDTTDTPQSGDPRFPIPARYQDAEGRFLLTAEEEAFTQAGKNVQVIKSIRDRTGAGLQWAKAWFATTPARRAAIAALAKAHQEADPTWHGLNALTQALYKREPYRVERTNVRHAQARLMADAAVRIDALTAHIRDIDVPPEKVPTAKARAAILQIAAKLAREGRQGEAMILRDACDTMAKGRGELARQLAQMKAKDAAACAVEGVE